MKPIVVLLALVVLVLLAACAAQPIALAPAAGGGSPLATPEAVISVTLDAAPDATPTLRSVVVARQTRVAELLPTPLPTPLPQIFALDPDPGEPEMGIVHVRSFNHEYWLRVRLADWELHETLLEHRALEGCRVQLADWPRGGPESPREEGATTLGSIRWGTQHWLTAGYVTYTPIVGNDWSLMLNVIYEAEPDSEAFHTCVAAAEQALATFEPSAASLLPTPTQTPIVFSLQPDPNNPALATLQARGFHGLVPFLVTVRPDEWHLNSTVLEHRALYGCRLYFLHWPTEGPWDQWEEETVTTGEIIWTVDHWPAAKTIDYDAMEDGLPILAGVMYSAERGSPQYTDCVAAAEEVLATARLP